MAYDAADHYVLLFGGQKECYISCSEYGYMLNGTWALRANGTWVAESTPRALSSRIGGAMAYDPVLGKVVLFGGLGYGGASHYNDTWEYSNGNWTQLNLTVAPHSRWGSDLVWDPGLAALVLIGGTDGSNAYNDTWEFKDGNWTQLTTNRSYGGRAWPMAAYDAVENGIVIFGGCTSVYGGFEGCSGGGTNATWIFNGTDWNAGTSTVTPDRLVGEGMDSESGLEPLVMYEGSSSGAQPGGKFWTFLNGTWSLVNSSGGPGYRLWTQLVYDPGAGVYWTFGGNGGTNGALWELLPDPAITTVVANRSFADVGQTVRFQANATAAGSNASYTWSGTPGCASVNSSELDCVVGTVGTFRVQLHVRTTDGRTGVSPGWRLVTGNAPQVGTVLVSPNPIFVNQSVLVTANVTGGAGNVTLLWTGLPSGCLGSTNASFRCQPLEAGNFSASLTATDQAGGEGVGHGSPWAVYAAPAIVGLSVSQNVSDVGESVTFDATFTGELGADALTWAGLPTGCSVGDASSVTCVPTAAGNGSAGVSLEYAPGMTVASPHVTYRVYADPTVARAKMTPATATAGTSVTFSTTFTPGSGMVQENWSGFPSKDCDPFGVPSVGQPTSVSVTCSLPAGSYSVWLSITDSTGKTAQGPPLSVTIAPAESVTPPQTNSTNQTGPTAPNVLLWVGLGVVAAGIAAAGLILWSRRKRRSPE